MLSDLEIRYGPRECRSLKGWEQRLSIPARSLLHHASQGRLDVFISPPLRQVQYALLRVTEDARPLTEGPLIWLSKDELLGFVPDSSTLAALLDGLPIEVDSFDTVICNNLSWDSNRGLVPSTHGHRFRPIGWRAGAFLILDSGESGAEQATDLPLSDGYIVRLDRFIVRPDDIYIRDADVKTFITSLKSYDFISDLFHNGAFTEEMPSYISGKLKEIIEANHVFWREHEGLGVEVRARKRAGTLEYLNDEFLSLCDKKTKPESLVQFAAAVCDPTYVAESKKLGYSATPQLLALLTAAKLFWSPISVQNDKPETHPSREEVVWLLRFMGLTETNAASYGATIIRPETAVAGKVGTRPPLFTHLRRSDLRPISRSKLD